MRATPTNDGDGTPPGGDAPDRRSVLRFHEMQRAGLRTLVATMAAVFVAVLGAVAAQPASAHVALVGRQALIRVDDELWLAIRSHGAVVRIDPRTGETIGRPMKAGKGPIGLTRSGGRVWVADYDGGAVLQLDVRTGRRVGPRIPMQSPSAVAVGFGRVWVAEYEGDRITAIEPRTGRIAGRTPVADGPVAVAMTDDAVWAANSFGSTVSRIDPTSGRVLRDTPSPLPQDLAVTGDTVWVANGQGGILRLRASDGQVIGSPITFPGVETATSLTAADGSVWAALQTVDSVARIDVVSARLTDTVSAPVPATMLVSGDTLFVADGDYATVVRVPVGDIAEAELVTPDAIAGPTSAVLESGERALGTPSAQQAGAPDGAASAGKKGEGGIRVLTVVGIALAIGAAFTAWVLWTRGWFGRDRDE